jgi:hypothetical protein
LHHGIRSPRGHVCVQEHTLVSWDSFANKVQFQLPHKGRDAHKGSVDAHSMDQGPLCIAPFGKKRRFGQIMGI